MSLTPHTGEVFGQVRQSQGSGITGGKSGSVPDLILSRMWPSSTGLHQKICF